MDLPHIGHLAVPPILGVTLTLPEMRLDPRKTSTTQFPFPHDETQTVASSLPVQTYLTSVCIKAVAQGLAVIGVTYPAEGVET